MKRYFLLPFHSTTLLLLGTFTLGWALVAKAGFLGIPMGLILLSWFFKYCFVLLDSITAGSETPPVLSVEMVNPIDEQRPVTQAAIVVLGTLLTRTIFDQFGHAAGLVTGSALLFELPASVAVLGITGNPFRAVWPPEIWAITRACGREYVLINISMFASGVLVYGLVHLGGPLWLTIALVQLWFLFAFSLVGGAIFEHRIELGIESRTTHEREAERTERERILERNRMLDRAHANFRIGKLLEGWQEIQAWLERQTESGQPLRELAAVLRSASSWDDVRPADRLAGELIAALLARKENGKALEVLEQRLLSNPKFRPEQPAHVARLAELASAAGKPALRRRLESNILLS
jgi:hypothetical protein